MKAADSNAVLTRITLLFVNMYFGDDFCVRTRLQNCEAADFTSLERKAESYQFVGCGDVLPLSFVHSMQPKITLW